MRVHIREMLDHYNDLELVSDAVRNMPPEALNRERGIEGRDIKPLCSTIATVLYVRGYPVNGLDVDLTWGLEYLTVAVFGESVDIPYIEADEEQTPRGH